MKSVSGLTAKRSFDIEGVASAALSRRRLLDQLARKVIGASGLLVLLSVLTILFVILSEVLPLFYPAKATPIIQAQVKLEGAPLLVRVDPYLERALVLDSSGRISINQISTRESFKEISSKQIVFQPEGASAQKIIAISEAGAGRFVVVSNSGQLKNLGLGFKEVFVGATRTVEAELNLDSVSRDISAVGLDGQILVASKLFENGQVTAIANRAASRILLIRRTETIPLIGSPVISESESWLTFSSSETIQSIAFNVAANQLWVAFGDNSVGRFNLSENADGQEQLETYHLPESLDGKISVLKFLFGGSTILLGTEAGAVYAVRTFNKISGDGEELRIVHTFKSHKLGVVDIAISERNKGFITLTDAGQVGLHYSTTGKTDLVLQPTKGINGSVVVLAPKNDGVFTVGANGQIQGWSIDNPHPESSWRTLFLPVTYEGYQEPAYVWQSTGGTDDFEPKLSLIPLIFGTLKCTFYALLIAIPLAIGAALYTSQFMEAKLRKIIKPMVEIMAALPSVVIGFVAGLWLAPLLEPQIVGLFMALLLLPLMIIIFLTLTRRTGLKFRNGSELLIIIPALCLGGWLSFWLGSQIDQSLPFGSFAQWMYQSFGVTVDQRNSIVAGIAISFCVIPIIFTLSEDVLTSVPKHLIAGSLALGATRWQTATLVVLPVALPGIFSAVMIGLGRAIGETMIVLMATGNTPLMDWSMFNGLRAMSANIAVELPEAPHNSTLYRVLFLTAFLLFAFTFVINSISETIRLRLRKRFQLL